MPPSTAVATTEPVQLPSVRKPPAEALRQLEQVVVEGNLAKLTEGERIAYYARVCESLGLNPLTRPFEYITLNNKLTLYARKDATDQLRDLHRVTINSLERERTDDLQIVTAYATDRYGRTDSSIGAVPIKGLSGEALANALMKAETKAKRRVTLSICGLGWMDEIEAQDQRAFEVAPRAAVTSAIRSRTAALTGGASEPGESEASVPTGGAEAAGVAVPPAAGSPDEPTKPRARRKAAPKAAGDDGYGIARAHASASDRGLDHAAVHRIAADVLEVEEDGLADFSVKHLDQQEWQLVVAAIESAPVDAVQADSFAAHAAVRAGLVESVDGEWWSEAESMFGKAGEDLTPAQVVEYGIRVGARSTE